MPQRVCDECGLDFIYIKTSGPARRFCTKRCCKVFSQKAADSRKSERRRIAREARPNQSCVNCDKELTFRQARFCSRRCDEIHRGQRLAFEMSEVQCALAECDNYFRPYSSKQKCCSEVHGKKHYNRVQRAAGTVKRLPRRDIDRDREHRRRANKAKASTGAPVRLAEIAARDKWKCSLCGKRVLKSKKAPHPSSPSLDHVIPLSKGGAHDPANVALAHLGCNVTKNNRGGGEQLALIG